ncbi:MAG: TldD/PmbA family protein [Cyanobacteria bacterium NC_groundwater_1444_Ag_S-0.65um_54_12]|nr:TldD/PmbA family protein [Cyanobacteria bacterium NC_groundwater_1444_Ag_S-0.65um_54_12]
MSNERKVEAGALLAEDAEQLAAATSQVLELALGRKLAAEVFLTASHSTRAIVQDGVVETFTLTEPQGMGIRVVDHGRTGYSYTESFSPDALADALAAAAANALIMPDAAAVELASFAAAPPFVESIYHPELATIPVERKIALALDLDQQTHDADARVKNVIATSYADTSVFLRIASTCGLDRNYWSSMAWLACQPLVFWDGQNKNYHMIRATRRFAELDPSYMAKEAVRRCIEKLGARQLAASSYPVVFAPEAFAALLGAFCGIFSAKVAQEGKSLLRERLGQRSAATVFSLTDDPLIPGGLASRPFDDEGCPSRELPLIAAGFFQNFMHNSETARRDRVASTGHAVRGSYKDTLRVGPSNLVVQAGQASFQDLVSAAPQVLHLTELTGLHAGTNVVSGDFSLPAQGFLYAGSERLPVHLITVAGNFYRLLESIEAIGAQSELLPSGIRTPAVLVAGLAIAGH